MSEHSTPKRRPRDVRLDPAGFRFGQDALLDQFAAIRRDRLAFHPCGHFLRRAVVVRLALEVGAPAVGLALHQRRSHAGAGAVHRLADGLVYGQDAVAVDGDAGQSVACAAVRDVLDLAHLRLARAHGVEVVLADVNARQAERRGDVQRFVEGPFVRRAVAEKAHRHLTRLAQFGR